MVGQPAVSGFQVRTHHAHPQLQYCTLSACLCLVVWYDVCTTVPTTSTCILYASGQWTVKLVRPVKAVKLISFSMYRRRAEHMREDGDEPL